MAVATVIRELFILGIGCWLLVSVQFVLALVLRRSVLSFTFVVMSLGCALALAREIKLIPLQWAVPLHMALVVLSAPAAILLTLANLQRKVPR